MSSVLDLLTPGSVWIKLHGRLANTYIRVLFVSNQDLKPTLHSKYPPQVIYANENGKILSRDINSFIEQFQFYNVDPDLEQRLLGLLDEPISENEENINSSNIPSYGISSDKSFVDEYIDDYLTTTGEGVNSIKKISASFIFISNDESPAIPSEILTESFVGFAQEPTQMYDKVQIKLTFALNEEKGVTLDSLYKVFCPQEDSNTVDAFVIKTSYETLMPTWNLFVSVTPNYTNNGLFGVVILTNDSEDKPVESKVPEEEVSKLPEIQHISMDEDNSNTVPINEYGILNVEPESSVTSVDPIEVIEEIQVQNQQSIVNQLTADISNQIVPHLVEEQTPKTE
jgi:hypothetical protein